VQSIVLLIIQKAEVQSAERSCEETEIKTSTKQATPQHTLYAIAISKLFKPYFAPSRDHLMSTVHKKAKRFLNLASFNLNLIGNQGCTCFYKVPNCYNEHF